MAIKKNFHKSLITVSIFLCVVIISVVLVFLFENANEVQHHPPDTLDEILDTDQKEELIENYTSNTSNGVFDDKDDNIKFISVWRTNETSSESSNNNQVRLPLQSSGNYNFVVEWGDDTDVNGSISASGNILGNNIRDVSCPPNHFLSGFSSTGDLICTLV